MFGLSRKIQSNGKWFLLTVNHAPKPCKIFYTCILPSIDFYPRKIEEREKQQELQLHIQAPARAPIAYPSIGESSDHTSKHRRVAPQHWRDRRTLARPRSSPPKTYPPKTDLILDPKLIGTVVLAIVLDRQSISLSLNHRIWWIFFVRFCFFCVYLLRNDIIYLFGSWENVSNK